MLSASHSLRRCQENPEHPVHSHLPRLLFHLAPRFMLRLCRYFCSASVLTLQSPCMGNQSPAASSASWARLCSLGPNFPMGWDLEGGGKAIPPKSFGNTLAQLDGAQHLHPVTDCAGCWQGCALLICLLWCPCSCCAGRACQRGTSVGPFSQRPWLCEGFPLGFLIPALQGRTLSKLGFSCPSLSATT